MDTSNVAYIEVLLPKSGMFISSQLCNRDAASEAISRALRSTQSPQKRYAAAQENVRIMHSGKSVSVRNDPRCQAEDSPKI